MTSAQQTGLTQCALTLAGPLPRSVSPSDAALSLWPVFQQSADEAIRVTDQQGVLVGLVRRQTLLALDPHHIAADLPVREIMETPAPAIDQNASLEEIWQADSNFLLVVDDHGRPCGLLNRRRLPRPEAGSPAGLSQQIDVLLDSAHNAIIAVDRYGFVTIFNRAAERIIRRTKQDAIGKHLSEVVIPLGLLATLRTGETKLSYKFVFRYSGTGPTHVYLANRTPVMDSAQVVGAVAVFQDISDLETISQELSSVKQLNQELQAVIESQYDGVIVTDTDGLVLDVNSAHERITGIPKADIKGRSMRFLADKGYYAASVVEEVLRQHKAASRVERFRTAAKNANLLMVTGSPVLDGEGRVARVVISVRDLTELNELRQQLEETRELTDRYRSELVELRGLLLERDDFIFNSPQIQDLLVVALRVAQVDSTVLLLGESGVGKEVLATLIRANSPRKDGPFIKINCAAIPADLLESELFGYEGGAFTGASPGGKAGMFELASAGTLFLDEIGDLPMHLQVKILRALQEREIQRVGGSKVRPVDVRIIAATNRDLEEMVRQERFRKDLYFRLNVVPLRVPPLRERREDIVPLVYALRDRFARKYKITRDFAPDAMELFLNYSWPGNVRELENIVERLIVTTSGPVVTRQQVLPHLKVKDADSSPGVTVNGLLPLRRAVSELERQLIRRALDEGGSTYKAAELLGVDQSTVVRKLKRLGE